MEHQQCRLFQFLRLCPSHTSTGTPCKIGLPLIRLCPSARKRIGIPIGGAVWTAIQSNMCGTWPETSDMKALPKPVFLMPILALTEWNWTGLSENLQGTTHACGTKPRPPLGPAYCMRYYSFFFRPKFDSIFLEKSIIIRLANDTSPFGASFRHDTDTRAGDEEALLPPAGHPPSRFQVF